MFLEGLMCTRNTAKGFRLAMSFQSSNTLIRYALLSPCYRSGDREAERFSNVFNVTQL